MLRTLLAGIGLYLGAHFLLPPIFVEPLLGNRHLNLTAPAAAAELSEIRDRGHLIVGIKANRPPLGFIANNGELSGFEIDIAHRLATEILGDASAIEFVALSNVDRINAVLGGEVDIAIAAITLTAPRRRLVSFSDPYYLDGTAFLVNNEIQTLGDLSTRRIATLNRSSTVAHVRYLLPSAQLIGVSSYAEGQSLLQTGQVDAYSGDASILTGWLSTSPAFANYSLLPNLISAEPLAIAIPKGTQYNALRSTINQSIRSWYAEEWLQERADFWALPSGILPTLLNSSDDSGQGSSNPPSTTEAN